MAQQEEFAEAYSQWHRLDELIGQVSCNPTYKADEVNLFIKMVDALKGNLDGLAPHYWKLETEHLAELTESLRQLADCMERLMAVHKEHREPNL